MAELDSGGGEGGIVSCPERDVERGEAGGVAEVSGGDLINGNIFARFGVRVEDTVEE